MADHTELLARAEDSLKTMRRTSLPGTVNLIADLAAALREEAGRADRAEARLAPAYDDLMSIVQRTVDAYRDRFTEPMTEVKLSVATSALDHLRALAIVRETTVTVLITAAIADLLTGSLTAGDMDHVAVRLGEAEADCDNWRDRAERAEARLAAITDAARDVVVAWGTDEWIRPEFEMYLDGLRALLDAPTEEPSDG